MVHKFLVSPAPRTALVLGRAVSSAIRGFCQALVLYVVALLLGIHLRLEWHAIVGVLAVVSLGAATFLTFSLIAACIVKSRELHGDWTGSYDAIVFREQCDLSAEHDAGLAAFSILGESTDLPGRCTEILDGPGRPYRVRVGLRFLRTDTGFCTSDRDRGEAVSEHYPLSRDFRQWKTAFEFARGPHGGV